MCDAKHSLTIAASRQLVSAALANGKRSANYADIAALQPANARQISISRLALHAKPIEQ